MTNYYSIIVYSYCLVSIVVMNMSFLMLFDYTLKLVHMKSAEM